MRHRPRVLECIFKGLAYGVGVTVALYAIAFLIELANCATCGCVLGLTDCAIPPARENYIWRLVCFGGNQQSLDSMIRFGHLRHTEGYALGIFPIWGFVVARNLAIFCIIAGTIIGFVYGIIKYLEANQNARETRVKQYTGKIESTLNKANSAVIEEVHNNMFNNPYKDEYITHIKLNISAEKKIYQATMDCWERKNFKNVEKGLSVLCCLYPHEKTYKTAAQRLNNTDLLIKTMINNGLKKSSENMSKILEDYAEIFMNTNTDKSQKKPKEKRKGSWKRTTVIILLIATGLNIPLFAVLIFESTRPINLNMQPRVSPISANYGASFVITSDGDLLAWGNNSSGQLGNGTTIDQYRPVKIMDNVVYVSSATATWEGFAMAIKGNGSLWAWGNNENGQLGDGTRTNWEFDFEIMQRVIVDDNNRLYPVHIMEDVVSVSSGSNHTVAITSDGSLWAWGSNFTGQLGNGRSGRNAYSLSPIRIIHPRRIADSVLIISAGSEYTMAIRGDLSLWAWGSNNYGQLGDGTITDRPRPTRVMDDVVAVSAGFMHTMAIRSDGSLWGWNWFGQLGNGTRETDGGRGETEPIKIMDDVFKVLASGNSTFALGNDGNLWAWGLDEITTINMGYPR